MLSLRFRTVSFAIFESIISLHDAVILVLSSMISLRAVRAVCNLGPSKAGRCDLSCGTVVQTLRQQDV